MNEKRPGDAGADWFFSVWVSRGEMSRDIRPGEKLFAETSFLWAHASHTAIRSPLPYRRPSAGKAIDAHRADLKRMLGGYSDSGYRNPSGN